jgi:RNA recognition motif-containing protein
VREREKARRLSAEPNRTLFVAGFDPRTIRTRDVERAFEEFGRLVVRRTCCAALLLPRLSVPGCPLPVLQQAGGLQPCCLAGCLRLQPGSLSAARLRRPAPPQLAAASPPPSTALQRCEIKKTFSFVEFERVEDAKEACEQLHGSRINGREITGARPPAAAAACQQCMLGCMADACATQRPAW